MGFKVLTASMVMALWAMAAAALADALDAPKARLAALCVAAVATNGVFIGALIGVWE